MEKKPWFLVGRSEGQAWMPLWLGHLQLVGRRLGKVRWLQDVDWLSTVMQDPGRLLPRWWGPQLEAVVIVRLPIWPPNTVSHVPMFKADWYILCPSYLYMSITASTGQHIFSFEICEPCWEFLQQWPNHCSLTTINYYMSIKIVTIFSKSNKRYQKDGWMDGWISGRGELKTGKKGQVEFFC